MVLIIEIFMPLFIKLIAPGFTENNDKLELAILLTRITFPFLFFISLASFFSAILNSYNKFGIAAAAPVILNIILICVLIFETKFGDNIVVTTIYTSFNSWIISIIILFIFVRKYFNPIIKISFRITKKVKFFFKKLVPSIFSSGITQINILLGL